MNAPRCARAGCGNRTRHPTGRCPHHRAETAPGAVRGVPPVRSAVDLGFPDEPWHSEDPDVLLGQLRAIGRFWRLMWRSVRAEFRRDRGGGPGAAGRG